MRSVLHSNTGARLETFLVAALLALLAPSARVLAADEAPAQPSDRPNILWLTCEDMSPNLGCYGDSYSATPNIDRLAAQGMRFTNASSNAPVCAAARTTIITGMYASSLGAQQMRSFVDMPARFPLFPKLLREGGYYTTNNVKEDYNVEQHGPTWADSSKKAHWKRRKNGQPFFSVFNSTITHESQIRNEIDEANQIHDPAGVRVPAYHPDTPEVRRDWAQYYDRITMMDCEVGAKLDELRDAGLAENTIVFFFSDHGSGMPRSKRTARNSGLNVPVIVYFPPKWRHLAPANYQAGGASDRLISFVDFAPTVLSIAGLKPADWMQGGAFCGKYAVAEPEFSFGFRGRMDERDDLVRSVRDKRYMYVRNFMPHRSEGQHMDYMFQTPTTRVWKKLFDEGKLNEAQSQFWRSRESEELYDLETDRDEIVNLAKAPEQADRVRHMRAALDAWEHRIKDVHFLSEWEMHERAKGSTPYDIGHDAKVYDFDAVYAAARLATSQNSDDAPKIAALLDSPDSVIRYWAATGLLTFGQPGFAAGREKLVKALHDDSPMVRIVAAEIVGRHGTDKGLKNAALATLMELAQPTENTFISMAAWNALDYLDENAQPAANALRKISPDPVDPPRRYGNGVKQLKTATLSGLN